MTKLMGTTKIELTDVNTGEKEVFENHNMVTNALTDIFKPLGLFLREFHPVLPETSWWYFML